MILFTLENKEDKLLIEKINENMSYADLEDFIEVVLTEDLELYHTADDKLEIACDKEDLDLFIDRLKEHAAEESISCMIDNGKLVFKDLANQED